MKKSVPATPEYVRAAIKALPVDPHHVHAAIEPVAGWRWVSAILEEEGITTHIANPFKTRLIAESRMKNDEIDARMLAELLKSEFLPESYRAPDDINRLRMIVRGRQYVVQLRTGIKNRIHAIATQRGLHLYKKSPVGGASLAIMRNDSADIELSALARLVKQLDQHVAAFDKVIERVARTNAIAKLLMTMPAAGPITAVSILAEVGDFARFPTANKLAAYSGLVPRQRSSGDRMRMGNVTKCGPSLLRHVAVEMALRIREGGDERLRKFYERLAPKCGLMRARVALGRKILVIMWHMVKTNTPYRPLSSESTPKRDDLAAGV
jgi:transposase